MKKVALFILPVILVGCATPYQEMGVTGGYTETPIREDVWRVTFDGNGFTDREQTYRYALLRASELTKREGYDYFVIVGSNQNKETNTTKVPEQTTGTMYDDGSYSQQTYGGQTTKSQEYETTITVKMEKGSPPEGNSNAVNPDFIIQKYGSI